MDMKGPIIHLFYVFVTFKFRKTYTWEINNHLRLLALGQVPKFVCT